MFRGVDDVLHDDHDGRDALRGERDDHGASPQLRKQRVDDDHDDSRDGIHDDGRDVHDGRGDRDVHDDRDDHDGRDDHDARDEDALCKQLVSCQC